MNKKEQEKIKRSMLFKLYTSFDRPCWITGIVFIVLKLTNNLDWSWWWITSPLWGYYIGGLIIIILFYLLAFIFLCIWHLLTPLICKLIFKFFSMILSSKFIKRCKDAYNQAQVQVQAQDYDVDITPNNEREEEKHIDIPTKIKPFKKKRRTKLKE